MEFEKLELKIPVKRTSKLKDSKYTFLLKQKLFQFYLTNHAKK